MEELKESELGKREYWEKRYTEEIANFENTGDPGEIWFGEAIVGKILKWLENNRKISKSATKILDVGCGNGMFLIELAAKQYLKLYGIDYSERAIDLAKSIAKSKGFPQIKLWSGDVLETIANPEAEAEVYNVIHDKGTFDAISLSSNAKEKKRKYLENIWKSCSSDTDDGFFIITSCNWSRDELNGHFNDYFEELEIIPTAQFQFGGKTGNTVSTIVYKKKS